MYNRDRYVHLLPMLELRHRPPHPLYTSSIVRPYRAMNASAFVLAAVAPSRALLSVRPWICGRPLAARLPLYARACHNVRMSADAPAEHLSEEKPVEKVGESSSEQVVSVVESASENEPTAVEEAQLRSKAETQSEPVAETTSEIPTEAESNPVSIEKVTKDVHGTADADGGEDHHLDAESARGQKFGGNKKRRRRTRAKREVTMPLEEMTVGMELEGTIKSLTGYGAFVGDMGTPTDGLLHVSQLRAGFVENVSDVVQVGERVTVRVLAIDLERGNFSLTMKTPEEIDAPRSERRSGGAASKKEELNKKWDEFSFDPKVFVNAQVTSITDFGAFCRLLGEDDKFLETAPTEGLIHISEVSEGRVDNISDVLSVDKIVKVRVISTDRKRNRISLSLRDFKEEPEEKKGAAMEKRKSEIAAEIETSNDDQPEFKTVMELAFEKARAVAAAKEAAPAAKE